MSKKKDAGKKEEVEADNRMGWVKARVRQTFPHVKNANFGKQFGLSTYVSTLFLFLRQDQSGRLSFDPCC
jgi:hypothetical protein